MNYAITKLITFYQLFLSFDNGLLRFFAPAGACRYPISCSDFTKQSILEKGILRGTLMGVKRVICCNPLTI